MVRIVIESRLGEVTTALPFTTRGSWAARQSPLMHLRNLSLPAPRILRRASHREHALAAVTLLASSITLLAERSPAASSKGCDGGGFVLLGLSGKQKTAIPGSSVPATFLVRGK